MTQRLELVWDSGCPNVEAARAVIRAALSEVGLPERWAEWQIGVDALPAHAQGFGSPTILVDGRDVGGHGGGDSDACCRVYVSAKGVVGVPAVEDVVRRLRSLHRSN